MEALQSLATHSGESWWNGLDLRQTRVIPVLLLSGTGFVKTRRFSRPAYLGDSINIVKIFNEKEADEIIILDIRATPESRRPDFSQLADIAGECFMPVTYGGGLHCLDDVKRIVGLGFEKVCLNSHAIETPAFVEAVADEVGSSTVTVAIDVKRTWSGRYEVYTRGGKRRTKLDPVAAARAAERGGAGELLINSIDRDGTMSGYDLVLIREVTDAVGIPVVACGGAADTADLRAAVVSGGASAVAAGSLFVFHGPHRAVLINMPSSDELREAGLP